MNAPISEQIKAEAAKSLLERIAERTKLVRFFRYNASAKHGVPIDDEKDIVITPDTSQKQETKQEPAPAQNIVQIVKTDEDSNEHIKNLERKIDQQLASTTKNATTQESSPLTMSDKVKGILQTLAVLGGLGAAGLVGYTLVDKNKPEVQVPYYSPYQYLEDAGEHLP